MNLKLDRNTMRIRATYEEAVELFKKGKLTEKLPLFYGELELWTFCSLDESFVVQSDHNHRVELYIPSAWLKNILSIRDKKRTSKNQLEIATHFKSVNAAHSFDIRFEIDQFTLTRNRVE